MFGSRKAKEAVRPIGGPQDRGAQAAVPQSQEGRGDTAGARTAQAAVGMPNSDDARRRAAIAVRQSLAFAQIVSVLMRSPHYKHYTLADMEWLVLPPLLTGQFSVAEAGAREGGPRFPAAVALWASVSVEVDKRLSESLAAPIRLRPDEWRSGEILWLVDAVGDGRVVQPLLKQLSAGAWKGREVKVRSRGKDGRAQVTLVSKLGAGDGHPA